MLEIDPLINIKTKTGYEFLTTYKKLYIYLSIIESYIYDKRKRKREYLNS